jgi:hypothetical protein
MLVVPLNPVPAQTLLVLLANQSCRLNVYQKRTGLFVDLYVNNVEIVVGVIAEDANRIVRSAYLGFIGDLAFFDTLGSSDPVYTGLGSQYVLMYLETADLQAAGLAA